jgi:Tfp pilus assembly protein PilF
MQEFGLKSWALVLAIAVAGSNSEAGEETAEFHLELGMVYANHQMYDKAIAAFTKAIELDSRYAYAFIWRAESHFAIGKHSKAICDLIDAARLAVSIGRSKSSLKMRSSMPDAPNRCLPSAQTRLGLPT